MGMEILDLNALQWIYVDSALVVLAEMGLIGAVVAGIAIIPAFFIGQEVTLPSSSDT